MLYDPQHLALRYMIHYIGNALTTIAMPRENTIHLKDVDHSQNIPKYISLSGPTVGIGHEDCTLSW